MAQQVVYLITNIENGKKYVGQTSDYLQRMRQYRYEARPDSNVTHMHTITNEMRKFGFDAFEFDILEECDSFEELDMYEREYIKKFDTLNPEFGYNSLRGGGAKRLGLTNTKYAMSDEERLKRSESIIVYYNSSFKVYPSAKSFAVEMCCDKSIITSSIRKGKRYKDHYIYYYDDARRKEYVDKNDSKRKAKYYEIGCFLNLADVETISDITYITVM